MRMKDYDKMRKMNRENVIEILEKYSLPCYNSCTIWELKRTLVTAINSGTIPKNAMKV